MNGEEAIAYMESVPWQGTRLGLERTSELLDRLGHPERRLRFVHIAGTNGKGSTAAMTASVLRAAGCRTGLYISPFLQVFNERMSVNGEQITGDELGALTERVRDAAAPMTDPPTEFELMTALAFLFFEARQCDLVVLEVGLGGRLDSTNVIPTPEAAVICNIGLDHVKELGDTLGQIAAEKAGIIKPKGEVILYEPADADVLRVVRAACERQEARLHVADFAALRPLSDTIEGQRFDYGAWRGLSVPLLGAHQLRNAAVVLEVIEVLRGRGFAIPDEAVRTGLSQTVWPGRFEVLRHAPWFIADGGHNLQCAQTVTASLDGYFPGKDVTFIVGVLADKDWPAIMALLAPRARRFLTVTPDSPRALPAAELAAHLAQYGRPVQSCPSAAEAVRLALREAAADDVICSVGSLYMTGEIRTAVLGAK